jgi:hypothetical protein
MVIKYTRSAINKKINNNYNFNIKNLIIDQKIN